MVTGAGTGTVLLLRWFWWRINAWSEISAMIAAAAVSLFLQSSYGPQWDSDDPQQFAYLDAHDRWHYDRRLAAGHVADACRNRRKSSSPSIAACIRRARVGHQSQRRLARFDAPTESLGMQFCNWILGCVLIYATLFGIGKLIFKEWPVGLGIYCRGGGCGRIDLS